MKFSLWTQYGALNSAPVFNAFRQGAHTLGFNCVDNSNDSDVDVIWSVLFNGRMAGNRAIWERNFADSKPTIVLEVGGIKRGTTWKEGLNGINRDAYFGPSGNDNTRVNELGLKLKPWRASCEEKKEKNKETNVFGETTGRLHMEKQDLSKLQTRKMKVKLFMS